MATKKGNETQEEKVVSTNDKGIENKNVTEEAVKDQKKDDLVCYTFRTNVTMGDKHYPKGSCAKLTKKEAELLKGKIKLTSLIKGKSKEDCGCP